jgi:protoheme IX farnesyltransferase
VGFYLGTIGSVDFVLMLHTVLGTALVACGASALNQLWEREHDAKMRRTETRPLPSGRLTPESVLIFGGACSIFGLAYLALAVNTLTALLAAVTLVSYVFIYTPLKRVTWLNTAVGAVPGALPPLMGWTAARNELAGEGWALFAILFFWQIPHFLAIAWMYRDEYAKAGFVMLPNVDPDGFRTARQAISHTLGLLMVSLLPFLFQMTGRLYLFGALTLGIGFIVCAILFARDLSLRRARALFFASILYLPLLMGLMVLDKLKH